MHALRIEVFPTECCDLSRPQCQKAGQGHDQLSIYVIHQSRDDVLSHCQRVVLRALRLFAIFWQLHVPRVCFLPVSTLNRFTEHRTRKPTDVLQRVLALRRLKTGEKSPCMIRLVSLKREFCKMGLQMLIPNLLESTNGRGLHALAPVLTLAVR